MENFPTSRGPANTGRPGPSRGIYFFVPDLKRFDPAIAPGLASCGTRAVSITGRECRLRCQHCGARILENMRAALSPRELLSEARRVLAAGGQSLLISGGAREDGSVPLAPFLPMIKTIIAEEGLRVLVHTGLVSPALAEGLAEAGVTAALIDIIGHRDTIKQVYHLPWTVADYEQSLRHLTDQGIPVAPHLVIGLHFGKVLGEERALEIISRYPVRALVLVGWRPLRGTAMAACTPPEPAVFGGLFRRARTLFPRTPVLLGCERPLGRHRQETERLALEAGLDGIAFPQEKTRAWAEAQGLQIRFRNDCCALVPEP